MPKHSDLFSNIWCSARPTTAAISGVLAMGMVAFRLHENILWIGLRVIPIVMITMSGFIMNDIFDRDKDRVLGLRRPITTGRLAILHAGIAATLMYLGALLIELSVGSVESVVILGSAAIGTMLYSPIANRYPIFKGVITSVLCILPLAYGAALSGAIMDRWAIIVIMVFITGRELILDIPDVHGDAAAGRITIPLYWGRKAAGIIGWTLMWLAVSFMLVIFNAPLSRLLIAAAALVLLISLGLYHREERKAMALTRLAMVLGALSVAIPRLP